MHLLKSSVHNFRGASKNFFIITFTHKRPCFYEQGLFLSIPPLISDRLSSLKPTDDMDHLTCKFLHWQKE